MCPAAMYSRNLTSVAAKNIFVFNTLIEKIHLTAESVNCFLSCQPKRCILLTKRMQALNSLEMCYSSAFSHCLSALCKRQGTKAYESRPTCKISDLFKFNNPLLACSFLVNDHIRDYLSGKCKRNRVASMQQTVDKRLLLTFAFNC